MIDSFINYLEYEKRSSPHTVLAYRKDLEQGIKIMLAHKGSYLLEVMVGKENNVFPMVPQGKGVSEIVLCKEDI